MAEDSNRLGSDPSKLYFYYNEHLSCCHRVLIALYEKNVEFVPVMMDLMDKKEQYAKWYLSISPIGLLPALSLGNECVAVGARGIIEWIDQKYPNRKLYPNEASANRKVTQMVAYLDPKVEVYKLTYGVACYHAAKVTRMLRWPYNDKNLRQSICTFLDELPAYLKQVTASQRDLDSFTRMGLEGKALGLKCENQAFSNFETFQQIINATKDTLNYIEAHLARDDHVGPWLCGPVFTAADATFTAYLIRLYQVGWDEFWEDGEKPHIAIYARASFERPSVIRATNWKAHEQEFESIVNENDRCYDDQRHNMRIGLAGLMAVAGIYAVRTFFGRR
jgi:glutathione S-transferase